MEKQKVKINNTEVAYIFLPNVKNLGTFVILHWWWWNADSWLPVGQEINNLGYNVYILDLPGFWDTVMDKVYNLDDYADVVEKFVKEFNLTHIYLMWHSNWGRISLDMALRWKTDIKKLILNNSAWIKRPYTLKQKLFRLIAKTFKSLEFLPLSKQLRNVFYRSIWWHDYLKCENPYIKATFLNMISSGLKEELPKINLDTLLIRGENDTYTPLKDGKLMSELIPNSKLVIIPDERHWIHLKSPQKLFEVLKDNL